MNIPARGRKLTEEDKDAIADYLTGGFEQFGKSVFDIFNDRPGFVASTDDINPVAGAVRAVTRFNCRQWARNDKSNYSAKTNAYSDFVCKPYLEGIGEYPGGAGVIPAQEGGLCPVLYSINWESRTFNSGTQEWEWTASSESNKFGPLEVRVNQVENCGGNDDLVPTSYDLAFVGGGTIVQLGSACTDQSPSYRNLVLARVGGGEDDCGSEPVIHVPNPRLPPSAPALPPSIEINIPGIGPINVSSEFNPDGSIEVCVLEADFCVTIDPSDGFPGGGGGGDGGGSLPPGDQGTEGTGGATGNGGEAEGEAPEGSVLTGLRMELLSAPDNAREFAPGIYRGGAYVYMGGDAGLDQDFAGSMLEDGQFITAEADNLTKWKVRANYGYNWLVIPFYREIGE